MQELQWGLLFKSASGDLKKKQGKILSSDALPPNLQWKPAEVQSSRDFQLCSDLRQVDQPAPFTSSVTIHKILKGSGLPRPSSQCQGNLFAPEGKGQGIRHKSRKQRTEAMGERIKGKQKGICMLLGAGSKVPLQRTVSQQREDRPGPQAKGTL